jgi:FtsP/CotA-like multicopper oxidase with cupredoxin domain
MLGANEPIRVQNSQRVLFRIVNASATLPHRLALPGHQFQVRALDGNAVSRPQTVPVIDIAPGERVDAIVEMNSPGVWILGETRDNQRNGGMGIVVEYRNAEGPGRWLLPPPFQWDYTAFGGSATALEPDGRIPLVFQQRRGSHDYTINGKSFPHTVPLMVEANRRVRMLFDNQSAEAHPVHLHRHTFEITRFDQTPTSGVLKDVVMVPAWREVEVDLVADQPGPSLLHCHQQFHMDSGFKVLMHYSQ